MRKLILLLCSVILISCGSDTLNENKATALLQDYIQNQAHPIVGVQFQNTEAFLVHSGSEVMTTVHYSVPSITTGAMVPQSAHAIFTRSQNGTWYLTMLFGLTLNIEVK